MTSLDQYFHFGRPVSTEKPPSWMIQYTGAGEAEYGFLNYGQISAFRCFTLSYHLFNFCLFCTNLKSNYREREKVFNVLVRFERATAASWISWSQTSRTPLSSQTRVERIPVLWPSATAFPGALPMFWMGVECSSLNQGSLWNTDIANSFSCPTTRSGILYLFKFLVSCPSLYSLNV